MAHQSTRRGPDDRGKGRATGGAARSTGHRRSRRLRSEEVKQRPAAPRARKVVAMPSPLPVPARRLPCRRSAA
ncbi:hypothetical protein GCM10011374_13470 [Kocuria dechangensis]|uniref:Uncharacterized protein n=1 Tax=Kocuria dechangensis TaxID=1176249 RepID=A0A917GMS1_9MICC|nr:hypothetical protein GCM10011374_13470 [Kocuria dechangensis]